jgi:hypothetical protein
LDGGMNQTYTKAERAHVHSVKELPCSICDIPGPSDAHHIKQNQPYLCVALCKSCHQDPHNGIHGRAAMWKIKKMDEMDALAVTVRRLVGK